MCTSKRNERDVFIWRKQRKHCSFLGISLSLSSCPDFLNILPCLHFLPLHITEDPLKYSLAMYHCALFSNTSYTPSPSLSSLSFLCLLHPTCYTTMTIVFVIRTQSRTVYTSSNRISCRAGTLSRCQKASATTADVLLGPPQDAAHSHCCEEVVSFIFSLSFLCTSRQKVTGETLGEKKKTKKQRERNRPDGKKEILES